MLVGINGWNIKVVAVIPCKSGTSLILVLNFLLKFEFLIQAKIFHLQKLCLCEIFFFIYGIKPVEIKLNRNFCWKKQTCDISLLKVYFQFSEIFFDKKNKLCHSRVEHPNRWPRFNSQCFLFIQIWLFTC